MWFRIELNKDRSVRTCVEVSGSLNEGRSVHYIEADSKASAIAILAAYLVRDNARNAGYARAKRAELKAAGLCRLCRKPRGDEGTADLCGACRKRYNARYKELNAGAPLKVKRCKSDEDRAAVAAARIAKRRERDIKHAAAKPGYARAKREATCYRETLEAFESMTPSRFRGWLVAKIAECQDKIDGKKTIAEHLQAAE